MPILNNANFEHACILVYTCLMCRPHYNMETICSIVALQHAPLNYMCRKYAGTPVVDLQP